jgi:hypothetical protein
VLETVVRVAVMEAGPRGLFTATELAHRGHRSPSSIAPPPSDRRGRDVGAGDAAPPPARLPQLMAEALQAELAECMEGPANHRHRTGRRHCRSGSRRVQGGAIVIGWQVQFGAPTRRSVTANPRPQGRGVQG